MMVPRPPLPPPTPACSSDDPSTGTFSSGTSSSSTRFELCDPGDADADFVPESTDSLYVVMFEHFPRDWERWQMNNNQAMEQVICTMDPATQMRFPNFTEPKLLWEAIHTEFEKAMKVDDNQEVVKLASCRLESYSTVAEWQAAQELIIRDLATCDIEVTKSWRKFYVTVNHPITQEWTNFVSTLELSGQAQTSAEIITHLLAIEAKLRREPGLSPDAALYIWKKR